MATPFNETPKWFEADFYLDAKLANLIAEDPKGNWTRASLVEAFTAADFANPYDHYLAYGDMEGLSPNPLFSNTEYLAAKTAAMGSTWTQDMVAKAIADAGLTLMQHYEQFGSAEGLSPSSKFTDSKYLDAKLDLLQTTEPDKAWTLDTLKAAFADAGLTPLDHYIAYSKTEGLDKYDYSVNGDPIPHPGNNIALTKGADTVTKEATVEGLKTSDRDDMISAIAGNSTKGTLTAGDVIDGGAGVDTLTVDMQANYSYKSGSIKNVEKIVLNNTGGYTFDAKGVEAADVYTVNGDTKDVTIKNVDSTDTSYSLKQAAGKFNVQINDSALAGKEDNVDITLNSVGTDAKTPVKISVKGTGTAGEVEGVTLMAQGKDSFVSLEEGHKTVEVMGAGNVNITTVKTGLKSFDASDATGKVVADLSAASASLKSITGGAGNDSISVGTAALAGTVFSGGTGDDTLTFKMNPGATVKTTINDFEKIVLAGGTSALNGTNITGVSEILLKGSGSPVTSVSADITKFANTELVLSTEGSVSGSVSYDGKGDLTFRNVDSKGDIGDSTVGKLIANSVETLTITSGDVEGSAGKLIITELDAKLATSLTVNTGEFGVNLSKGDLHLVDTITVAGGSGFSYTVDATSKLNSLTTIDASDLNGTFTFDAKDYTTALGKADAALTITGSAVENNTVVGTAKNDFITFTGGAGVNKITGGNGADVITLAGSSDDIVIYAATGTASAGLEGGDTIIGFETGSDVIQFAASGFLGAAGVASFNNMDQAPAKIEANQVNEIDLVSLGAGEGSDVAKVLAALNVGYGNTAFSGVSGSAILSIDDSSDTYLWAYTGTASGAFSAAELKLIGVLEGVTGNDAFVAGDVMIA